MKKTIDVVFEELMAMPRTQFLNELEQRGDGDIASMLLYTGALTVRETEAERFFYATPEASVVPHVQSYEKRNVDKYTPYSNRFVQQISFSSALLVAGNDINYVTNQTTQISILNESSSTYNTQNKEDGWKKAA